MTDDNLQESDYNYERESNANRAVVITTSGVMFAVTLLGAGKNDSPGFFYALGAVAGMAFIAGFASLIATIITSKWRYVWCAVSIFLIFGKLLSRFI